MSKQPEARRLADALFYCDSSVASQAARELVRLHEVSAELLSALRNLDEAYCRAGSPMTRECRAEDRKRLIAARAAIAKAEAA